MGAHGALYVRVHVRGIEYLFSVFVYIELPVARVAVHLRMKRIARRRDLPVLPSSERAAPEAVERSLRRGEQRVGVSDTVAISSLRQMLPMCSLSD